METQHLIIEVGRGRKRQTRIVEIPADEVLIAASLELRRLGQGCNLMAGRYGDCVGGYYPPNSYTMESVDDPSTVQRGATTPGGTIPERCVFWYKAEHKFADTMFDTDPPQLYFYCKKVSTPDSSLFESEGEPIEEGTHDVVPHSVYERQPELRAMCLRLHGSRCKICGMSFDERYGTPATGFIHVHHLEPLGAVGRAHIVNPTTDLIPVCPNCHAVIHLRTPPFTPDEVRSMLRPRRGS